MYLIGFTLLSGNLNSLNGRKPGKLTGRLRIIINCQNQEAFLRIQPTSPVVIKEVGKTLALTCRPVAPKPDLVTQLEWRDPRGRRIDERNKASPLYVQKVSSDTGLMLIFTKLEEQQQGKYSCHASYAATEQLVAEVEVSTYDEVDFVDAPENQYPIAGQDYQIKCKVKGKPEPIVEWFKGDQSIVEASSKYIPSNNGLLIKNVTELDDGVYKCSAVVVDTGAFKVRPIKVEVQVPPKIKEMNSIKVVEGEQASIKCSATGKPPPTYTWIKVDRRNDLSKTDRFDVKRLTGELIMNRVESADDGFYKCTAENPAGRVETTVKINVLVKPRIYELLNQTASEKTDTTLICKAIGRPPPKVTFRKHGITQTYLTEGRQSWDPRIKLEQLYDEEKGEGIGKMSISNLTRPDDGLYECKAQNDVGVAVLNGHITVWFKPTFNKTKNLPPVWTWDGKPGNLSCLPEAIPNATITWRWRDIEISEENFNNGRVSRNNFEVQGRSPQSFLIVNAYDNRDYFTKYECIARNALGEASLKIELKKGFAPGSIQQVRRQSITATTVKFSIIPPQNFDRPPIRSITVQYKMNREEVWRGEHTWSFGAPYILENLIPEVTYHLRFAARNDVGLGGFTNVESITMPRRSEPAEPTLYLSSAANRNVAEGEVLQNPYSNHIDIRWNVPADNGEAILYYTVKYCISDKDKNNVWQESECSELLRQSFKFTNTQLDNLLPDTVYKVELRAHNAIGASTPAVIRVRTARGTGPVVRPQKSASMSSSMIIGIVVAAILVVLLVVDLTCFLVNRTGLIALCCERSRKKKQDEEDPKLSREEREPLKQEIEKPVSLEYDGKQVYSKTGDTIIGKHSAV